MEQMLIGAVFPTQMAAAKARKRLFDKGLIAASRSGDSSERLVLEPRFASVFWRSAVSGGAIGLIVGLALGALAAWWAFDSVGWVGALALGGTSIGFIGIVLGGYLGMARHRPQYDRVQEWAEQLIGP